MDKKTMEVIYRCFMSGIACIGLLLFILSVLAKKESLNAKENKKPGQN